MIVMNVSSEYVLFIFAFVFIFMLYVCVSVGYIEVKILGSSFEACVILFSDQSIQHSNSFSSFCWFSSYFSFYESL